MLNLTSEKFAAVLRDTEKIQQHFPKPTCQISEQAFLRNHCFIFNDNNFRLRSPELIIAIITACKTLTKMYFHETKAQKSPDQRGLGIRPV